MKDKIVEIFGRYRKAIIDAYDNKGGFPIARFYVDEVAQLYSAGEEVSDDLRKQFADELGIGTHHGWSLITEAAYQKWLEKKLTRPTVTEEEIERILIENELLRTDGVHVVMIKGIFPELYNHVAKAIKELLNQKR